MIFSRLRIIKDLEFSDINLFYTPILTDFIRLNPLAQSQNETLPALLRIWLGVFRDCEVEFKVRERMEKAKIRELNQWADLLLLSMFFVTAYILKTLVEVI